MSRTREGGWTSAGLVRRDGEVVMRTRRFRVWCGLVAASVLFVVLGMGWAVVARQHRSVLAQVDRDIAAGRYGAARQHLIGLSTRWMGPEEVDYRLGLCEGYLGHDQAALAAWGRLPARSPFAEAAALNSAAVEMNRGRWSAAETILVGALARPGRQVVTVGQLLNQLFMEARADRREACRHRVGLATRQSARLATARGGARAAPRPHRGAISSPLAIDAVPDLPRSHRQAGSRGRPCLVGRGPTWRSALASSPTRGGGSSFAWVAGRRIRRSGRPCSTGGWRWSKSPRSAVPWPICRLIGFPRAGSRSSAPGWRRGGATPQTEQRRSSTLVQDEPGHCSAWERLAVLAAQAGRGRACRASCAGARPPWTRPGSGTAISTIRIASPTTHPSSLDWPRRWGAGSKPSAS